MISHKTLEEVNSIGKDAWELSGFLELPVNASIDQQISELRAFKTWMRDHVDTTSRRVDRLITRLEDESFSVAESEAKDE